MTDPNLPILENAVRKLAPFLDEIVFVGGVTLGQLIADAAAAPIAWRRVDSFAKSWIDWLDCIASRAGCSRSPEFGLGPRSAIRTQQLILRRVQPQSRWITHKN